MFEKKWYNNFSIGVILAALLALGVSIFLLFKCHLSDLLGWATTNSELLALMTAPYLITVASRMISGVGYLMRPFDIVLDDNTLIEITTKLDQLKYNIEKKAVLARINRDTGYFTGNVLGLLVSAIPTTLQVVGKVVAYAHVLGPFAIPLAVLDNAGTDAGFFSRLFWVTDSFFDKEKKFSLDAFMNHRRLNARLGIIGTVLLSIGLVLAMALTMSTPVGPLAIALTACTFFSVISSSAAAGEYTGDIADICFGQRTIVGFARELIAGNKPKLNIKAALTGERKNEYRGKLIGFAIAAAVIVGAVALIALHVVCPPTIGIWAIVGFCATALGVFPGIGGRLMKTRDIKNAELAKAAKMDQVNQQTDSAKKNPEQINKSEKTIWHKPVRQNIAESTVGHGLFKMSAHRRLSAEEKIEKKDEFSSAVSQHASQASFFTPSVKIETRDDLDYSDTKLRSFSI